MCLRQTLPSGENYPAALIELSSVSSSWQQLLFLTPGLWTEIHVRYSAHDLLATLSLFLHFSDKAPLHLIVWNTMGPKWEDIKLLLLPHTDRIRSLALGNDPPIYSDTPYAGAAYMSLASDIFNSLNRLPYLVDLDFGRVLQIDPSQLKPLDLTSNIRILTTISVALQDLGALKRSIILLSGRTTPIYTSYTPKLLSDFLPVNSRSPFDGADDSILALNFSIMSLADVLISLDCRLLRVLCI